MIPHTLTFHYRVANRFSKGKPVSVVENWDYPSSANPDAAGILLRHYRDVGCGWEGKPELEYPFLIEIRNSTVADPSRADIGNIYFTNPMGTAKSGGNSYWFDDTLPQQCKRLSALYEARASGYLNDDGENAIGLLEHQRDRLLREVAEKIDELITNHNAKGTA